MPIMAARRSTQLYAQVTASAEVIPLSTTEDKTAQAYYDSDDADTFYSLVWGGQDLHIGLYDETSNIREASDLTIDEMAVFEQRLGTALLSPRQRREIRSYLNQPPSLDECLVGLGEVSGRLALRDAAMMSSADGVIDEEEQIVLESIAKHIGVDDGVVDDLLDWVMRGYDWMQEGLDLLNVE